jgi:tRNA(fMet)-specific endonuclease VapC
VHLILDTNAVSAILDGDRAVQALVSAGQQIYIPVIVLGEYRFGLLGSPRRENYERSLQRLIERSAVLNVDEETAGYYAQIRLELKRAGAPIPVNDEWIAAIARQHGFALLSRDHHFDRVAGLHRLAW